MKAATKSLALVAVCFLFGTGYSAAEPLLESTDAFVAGGDNIAQYRIPALVTTGQGTLIAICDARVEKPGDAINNIDLAMKRSLDNGRTWGPLKIIADFPGQQAAADPCVLVDRQTDTVWVLYDHILDQLDRSIARKRERRTIMLHVMYSKDDGQTWSKPVDITRHVKQVGWEAVAAAPGRGIQTRDARLVFPCYSRRAEYDHAHLLSSRDRGQTWQISSDAGPKLNECQVVELVDGSAMLNMRSYRGKGCRAIATSIDGGKAWSKIVDDTQLPEPKCQASFIRHTTVRDGASKNRLLFANPANTSKRVNMTVRLSYDEGKTWPISRVIHSGPSAYSCLSVLPDGTIGLLYENGSESAYEKLTFARFNLEWLTGGRDRLTSK